MTKCKATHDGKHRPQKKLGSKTGYICKGCREEITVDEKEQL